MRTDFGTWRVGSAGSNTGACGVTSEAVVAAPVKRWSDEERIRALMAELNHRAKNMLMVVLAISRQTATGDPKDFIARLQGRIQALSVIQDLLIESSWRGVALPDLVWSQLPCFQDLIATRIELDGPPLLISAPAAQTIGMALHELSVNAGKYGALSCGEGCVEIKWNLKHTRARRQVFAMSWREKSGPSISEPARFGFGTAAIRDVTASSFDAQVELVFPASGLEWRLECEAEQVLALCEPST
jgi:two-component sensor histidine kinase